MLRLFADHLFTMASLVSRISAVLSAQQAEIASLKQQLADALADDAADDAAIEAAEKAAAAAAEQASQATETAERLQSLVDADVVEDQAINELLAPFEVSVSASPNPVDDPAPDPEAG